MSCGLRHGPEFLRCPVTGAHSRPTGTRRVLDGRYELAELLGEGATGMVYRALDLHLGEAVAVKRLRPGVVNPRVQREVAVGSRLRSEHVVRYLDTELGAARPYLVVELVVGGTLERRLEEGPLSLAEARALMGALTKGMRAIHSVGLVHRDLSPSNVLLPGGQTSAAKVGDLGLVRTSRSDLTATGAVLGTPGFMSPEQAQGHPADARSDIWSLAALLWVGLAGRPLHGEQGLQETLFRTVSLPAPRLSQCRDDVPGAIDAALVTALARPPEARYSSVEDFAEALLA